MPNTRIVRSAAVIQRVSVKLRSGQKEIKDLTEEEMLEYLQTQLFARTLIGEQAVTEIQAWLKTKKNDGAKYRRILTVFGGTNRQMPESVKDFSAGKVVLTRAAIEKAAKSSGAIEAADASAEGFTQSAYFLTSSGSGLTLSTKDDRVLGWIRFNIAPEQTKDQEIKVGKVETINVKPEYQGLNLSRILMAAFCARAIAEGATEYRLATEDTSKGWWGQWGGRDLKAILNRGDMQRIHLPVNVQAEAEIKKKEAAQKEAEEKARAEKEKSLAGSSTSK